MVDNKAESAILELMEIAKKSEELKERMRVFDEEYQPILRNLSKEEINNLVQKIAKNNTFDLMSFSNVMMKFMFGPKPT